MSIINKKIQRTRKTFEEKMSCQSQNTQDSTRTALNNFDLFGVEKYQSDDLATELKLVDEEQVFDILQEWINWNSSIHPRTMAGYWSKVRMYLHYRSIKLHPLDIKQELNFPHNIQEDLHGITREEIQKLFTGLKYKYQLLFTCQSSSMMRIGEMLQIKKKHLETETEDGVTLENIIVNIPAHITKLKRSRTTFFSTEASKMLRPWLKLEDDDLIFTKQTSARFAITTIEQVLRRALIRVGLDQRYESNNQYKINTHSFRAYGITKLSRYDENLAKKMAGHIGYQLGYDRLETPEKLEIYKRCEIDLLIDNAAVQKAIILKLEMENKKKGEFYAEKFDEIYKLLKDKLTDHTDP